MRNIHLLSGAGIHSIDILPKSALILYIKILTNGGKVIKKFRFVRHLAQIGTAKTGQV
jgi:hypothetical protein